MNNQTHSKRNTDYALICDACFEEIAPENLEFSWIEDNEHFPQKVHNFFLIHREPCNTSAHAHIKKHSELGTAPERWDEEYDMNDIWHSFSEMTFVNPYDRNRAFYALGAMSTTWEGPIKEKIPAKGGTNNDEERSE